MNKGSIKQISIKEVEYSAFTIAKAWMSWDEPIPDFSTRFPNILESCISTPFQKFDKKGLYKGLNAKAAILFYLMIKNHPFKNGNKRIAVTTLLVFLFKNKKWLDADNTEFYNFARWIAQSPPDMKNESVQAIEKFIKKHIIKLK